MFRIPFNPSSSADQTFRVLIPELQVVELRLVWNVRGSGWDVMVSNTQGAQLGFLRLEPRTPLLYEHAALSPIAGDIVALPLSEGSGKPLTEYDALGDSWGLFWVSPDDMKEWRNANGLG